MDLRTDHAAVHELHELLFVEGGDALAEEEAFERFRQPNAPVHLPNPAAARWGAASAAASAAAAAAAPGATARAAALRPGPGDHP